MPGPQFFFFAAVALVTAIAAIDFAFRPSERRLAVIRPLCAATICAGLASFLMGVANGLMALRYVLSDAQATSRPWHAVLPGLAESFAPLIIAFAGVAVAWLLVAVGLRRQA
jgi:hypothetical protein